eukprot:1152432-Pelagomonas_calceolata.AAC.4
MQANAICAWVWAAGGGKAKVQQIGPNLQNRAIYDIQWRQDESLSMSGVLSQLCLTGLMCMHEHPQLSSC